MASDNLREERQLPAMDDRPSPRDDASHEAKNHGKRPRSVVLKTMLKELASVMKESRKAMDEIEASQVKTDPGLENEHALVNPGGAARKSYHASIYRASFQSSASRRSIQHNKVSEKGKGKTVGVTISDDPGRKREKGKGKGCASRMAAGVARGTRQKDVHLPRGTARYLS